MAPFKFLLNLGMSQRQVLISYYKSCKTLKWLISPPQCYSEGKYLSGNSKLPIKSIETFYHIFLIFYSQSHIAGHAIFLRKVFFFWNTVVIKFFSKQGLLGVLQYDLVIFLNTKTKCLNFYS